MKTKMKKMMLAMMVIVFASANALAFEDSLKVNETKSFDFVLSNVQISTKITLIDKSNNILFQQNIKKGEGFSKKFNLELLQAGEYKVEIENASKIKVLTVVVNDTGIDMESANSIEFFKPVISEKSGKVYVSQFSPEESPLYIAVYNNRNELIHEETLEGKMDLGKIFDFSNSYSGKYRFYMESNDMGYNQLVYIEK